MYDVNPVHKHLGSYLRDIDVLNFKWKCEDVVPEELFSGGGVQIWQPFVSYFYFFSGVNVDTDFDKTKIRRNLKHKYDNYMYLRENNV